MGELTSQDAVAAYKSAMEDRAALLYFVVKTADESKQNIDEMLKKACYYFGEEKGSRFGDIQNPGEFVKALASGPVSHAMKMDKEKYTAEEGILNFGTCVLVEKWRKLGCTDEQIKRLCGIASQADYGIISNFADLSIEFPKRIGNGDDCCRMIVTGK